MKARHPQNSFRVSLAVGRTESDLTARRASSDKAGEQLNLFRENLSRPAKIQLMTMLAMSDPKALDKSAYARIADLAEAMGYERQIRSTDGKAAFDHDLYQRIEEVGMNLRRREIPLFIREVVGKVKDGRTPEGLRDKVRDNLVSMTVLQEFGFYYEDEEGQPIDLASMTRSEQEERSLINVQSKQTTVLKYDVMDDGQPIWAIPMTDPESGKLVLNADGTPRRRQANGITWRWSTRFAEMTRSEESSWLVWMDDVRILRKYLSKPITFDLIWLTLFHKSGPIEFGYDSLIDHLDIRGRNRARNEAAIDSAFQDLLNEGIIDQLPTVREPSYYKPAKKTGRPRRVGQVYQWRKARRPGPSDSQPLQLEARPTEGGNND